MAVNLDAPEDQGLGATQMHDAAIAHGLVERPERVVTADEHNAAYTEELEAEVERYKAQRSVAELEELEEDGDDSILQQLREKRMQEIRQQKQMRDRAGQELEEISAFEFEEKVKIPSKQGFVLLLVYRPNHAESLLLLRAVQALAARFPSLLCLRMAHCAELAYLPPQDCPVLLLYRDARVAKQWATLAALGGRDVSAAVLEWKLGAEQGAIDTQLEEDPLVAIEKARRVANSRRRVEDSDDSEDDWD